MLSSLVCTMFLTLCVDVGWKPAEDGKGEVYVIQIQPEQGEQMIKEKGFITSEIPAGTREVQIQFRNEKLSKIPTNPTLTTNRPTSGGFVLEESPLESSRTSPYAPPNETGPPNPAEPGIVQTSLNDTIELAPIKTSPPKETAPSAKRPTPKTQVDKNTEEGGTEKSPEATGDSYLNTAIASWIISVGLFAMVFYLAWIHLDLRRRYQALLDRTLLTPGLPGSTEEVAKDASLLGVPDMLSPEIASTAEEPPQKSTLVELDGDPLKNFQNTEALGADPDETDLRAEVFDDTASLLKNTNQVITQVPGEAELETIDPRQKAVPKVADAETVYGLPETSEDEPSEESEDDDDADNWDGIE